MVGSLVYSVLGAGGFIGRNLTRRLSRLGDPVHEFTRQEPFLRDGRLHPAVLASDVIFYVATRISPAVAERDPLRVAEENADFRSFVDGLRDCGHRPLVVLAGSGGTVYEPGEDPPYRESSPTRANTAYSAAKLFQEAELLASRRWTTPVVLRLGNVYGPGQRTGAGYGVIAHWMETVLAGESLHLLGDPGTCRDYVHVHDVVDAMLAVVPQAARVRGAGEPLILNIASGEPTSLAQVRDGLESAVGRPLEVHHSAPRAFDRRDVWLDVSLAERELGWRPRIPLSLGLTATWHDRLSRHTPADGGALAAVQGLR